MQLQKCVQLFFCCIFSKTNTNNVLTFLFYQIVSFVLASLVSYMIWQLCAFYWRNLFELHILSVDKNVMAHCLKSSPLILNASENKCCFIRI